MSFRAAGAALGFATLAVLTGWASRGETGLIRTISAADSGQELDVHRVAAIDLDDVEAVAALVGGDVTVVWRGVWDVPGGPTVLRLDGTGTTSWAIDGVVALEHTDGSTGSVSRTVLLAPGFHPIEVRHLVDPGTPAVSVSSGPASRPPAMLDPARLKPRPPRHPALRAFAGVLRRTFGLLGVLAAVLAVTTAVRRLPGHVRSAVNDLLTPRGRIARFAAWTVLGVVLVQGALLRLDAITAQYGAVSAPGWLATLQSRRTLSPETIRPAAIRWGAEPLYPHADGPPTRYRSDPYVYLEAARTMTSFYRAHFREPVFPFATRLVLAALGNQDVAVSVASAGFSLLAVWLTYLLAAALWSRPAGLLAAAGLSLDVDVVFQASHGWRDDAYMAAVVASLYLLLRWWRTSEAAPRPLRLNGVTIDRADLDAAWLGVIGGLAVLTRIMAVPLLAAGVAWILVVRRADWRRQLRGAAIAVVVAAVIAAPYFVNCWRVYGDPLYTFNVHGGIYSAAEGEAHFEGSTASYVRQKIASQPVEAIDTVAQGVTTYPFSNKWEGLNAWHTALGDGAAVAALAGLLILVASAEGRLLVVAAAAALLPFSFTWPVDPDYRFTLFAYPVWLAAAGVACAAGASAVRSVLLAAPRRQAIPWTRVAWRPWLGMVATGAFLVWFVSRISPPLAFAEALATGEDAMLEAGVREAGAFGDGWSPLIQAVNVRARVVTGEAVLHLRLPSPADYPVTLRLDPFPRPLPGPPPPLPTVEILLNGSPVGRLELDWDPARVGSYEIVLPRGAVRRGDNRLVLRILPRAGTAVSPGVADGEAAALWYARVHPADP